MRALAEFIMRGRLQACLVALVGNLVPIVSAAAVGLVTLRCQLRDGIVVCAWALLPVLVAMLWADINPVLVTSSIASVIVVLVVAQILKQTASWPRTLVSVVGLCVFAYVLVGVLVPAPLAALVEDLRATLVQLGQDGGMEQGVSFFHLLIAATAMGLGVEHIEATFVTGFLAWLTAINAIICLLVARWWQALLYNPGGFQQEFHRLRLDRVIALGLVLAIVACNLAPAGYATWASLLELPLLLAGLGVVHYTAHFWNLGTAWLVAMYLGLLLFGPLSLVLIGIGFLDSVYDLRARLKARKGQ